MPVPPEPPTSPQINASNHHRSNLPHEEFPSEDRYPIAVEDIVARAIQLQETEAMSVLEAGPSQNRVPQPNLQQGENLIGILDGKNVRLLWFLCSAEVDL